MIIFRDDASDSLVQWANSAWEQTVDYLMGCEDGVFRASSVTYAESERSMRPTCEAATLRASSISGVREQRWACPPMTLRMAQRLARAERWEHEATERVVLYPDSACAVRRYERAATLVAELCVRVLGLPDPRY